MPHEREPHQGGNLAGRETCVNDISNIDDIAEGAREQVPNAPQGEPVELGKLRFRRRVDCLHRLAPRVLRELLVELGGARLIRRSSEMMVRRYVERLDRVTLASLGADEFLALPTRRIGADQ